MADSAVANVAKPQMRGLLYNVIKRNLIGALVLSGLCGFGYKLLVGDVRKRKYAEFYRTYDAEKEFEEMRKRDFSNLANL